MTIGDKVKFTLYDREFTGSILKIYTKEGWKGYINIQLEDNQQFGLSKIDLPIGLLKVIK
tara:strand:+ start:27 stop:206 length:180 start_codon:yes stop_codon:yes gene_type:complete